MYKSSRTYFAYVVHFYYGCRRLKSYHTYFIHDAYVKLIRNYDSNLHKTFTKTRFKQLVQP